MKKIFTLIMVACLSLIAFAQTTLTSKPQVLKAIMAKEHLSNMLQSMQHPAQPIQQRVTAKQTAEWGTYSTAAKAPANLNGLDTTEVHFTSFYDDPIYYESGDWYITVDNERYKFIFDIYSDNATSPAGTYTEKDLDEWFSWCMFPEANGDTHYYKTCTLTIQEEKVSENLIKYTLDALVLATCGIGGEEYGYFKVHAEHKVIKAQTKQDIALYNCSITPEEDRWSIYGKDNEIEVDLTFFTETGIDGYYTHKLLDDENSKIVHNGKEKGIMDLEGVIYGAENIYGGLTYVFMFETFTTDTCFYNVAMEAPVVAKDTIEIKCNNMSINDAFGMSHSTIEISATNEQYDVYAGYIDTKVTTPKEYKDGTSHVYLTDLKTGQQIESIICNLKITGNKLQGFQVEICMLGDDYNYYIMHLSYSMPTVKETKVLDFKNISKTMYYIDALGLKELQIANFDGEYSVSFDILYVDQVMGGEFDMSNMFAEQTFLIHHVNDNGEVYDSPVKPAEFGGKIWQENDTTFLTASILGFDSIQYEISMFHTIPTPTEVVTYTFNGLENEEAVLFTNAVSSSGIFILDGMSEEGDLMAKLNVERITTKSVEGTFYNDGIFDHTDFYPTDTWVKVWNATTREYDEYSVQKGTMTVTIENNVLTAVASFICDNAVQYDLTFITEYTRERIPFDKEDEDIDYTFEQDSYINVIDWRPEGYRIIELIMVDADATVAADFYFIVDQDVAADPDIVLPAGVYPINSSWASGTTLACSGILPDGPAPSYVCLVDEAGYLNSEGLWCMVDGTVTIENVGGKMKVEVDALNSYDRSVKLHYSAAAEVPSSFPRKYLIEHFTGEDCGYCPYGMFSILEYTQTTSTPCIWVSHHYGFANDEYTIPENAKIGAACGVQGAPSMAMNRTKMQGATIAFHPGYLVEEGFPELIETKCATEAEASVVIDHTYDAATRELNVTVSGQVANTTVTEYLLTVLVKENGLIGKQSDYNEYSFKAGGYKEFVHPRVVRDVLCSDALGDKVAVENQAYSKSYTFTLPEAWVAENCGIVAYITPTTKKPIINAEETPLVAGTTGGEEYVPFGVTQVSAPTNATKLKFDNLTLSKPSDDKLAIQLIASSSTRSALYGPMKLVVTLEFNTPDSILPVDTLQFVEGDELNTFSAGTVNIAEQTYGGSNMAYYLSTSLEEEVWQLCHGWRIKSGNLLVYPEGGFYTSGKLANGKGFQITCTLPEPTDVENIVFDKAHVEKLMREGQFVIRIDGVEYDIQGRLIKQ